MSSGDVRLANHLNCVAYVKRLLKKDRDVKKILRALKGENWDIAIRCLRCEGDAFRGGYDSREKSIVLCENHLQREDTIRKTLKHELIHAFDDDRGEIDWDNPRDLARTEIRASRLSGECDLMSEMRRWSVHRWPEMLRERWARKNWEDSCVLRRAAGSVFSSGTVGSKEEAARVVKRAFDMETSADRSPL